MRIVAYHGNDAVNFAVVVEQHLRFGGFKFHCAAGVAFFLQYFE